MTTLGLDEIKDTYIIAKESSDRPLVWQSPRGAKIEDPTERWSLNPSDAFTYTGLSAASGALERMSQQYPDEFIQAKLYKYREFRTEYVKKRYNTISELKQYNPKAKTVYVLEHQGKETYYTSEDDRQEDIKSNVGYTTYELKLK